MKLSHYSIKPWISVLFLCVFCCVSSMCLAQTDHKKGTIKVRKPKPFEFYIELDEIPAYRDGDLIVAMNSLKSSDLPASPDPHVVVLEVIIDKQGSINWVQVKSSLGDPFDSEAVRISKRLGQFQPAKLEGNTWPALFSLPVRFQ
jgi:TonB family protein